MSQLIVDSGIRQDMISANAPLSELLPIVHGSERLNLTAGSQSAESMVPNNSANINGRVRRDSQRLGYGMEEELIVMDLDDYDVQRGWFSHESKFEYLNLYERLNVKDLDVLPLVERNIKRIKNSHVKFLTTSRLKSIKTVITKTGYYEYSFDEWRSYLGKAALISTKIPGLYLDLATTNGVDLLNDNDSHEGDRVCVVCSYQCNKNICKLCTCLLLPICKKCGLVSFYENNKHCITCRSAYRFRDKIENERFYRYWFYHKNLPNVIYQYNIKIKPGLFGGGKSTDKKSSSDEKKSWDYNDAVGEISNKNYKTIKPVVDPFLVFEDNATNDEAIHESSDSDSSSSSSKYSRDDPNKYTRENYLKSLSSVDTNDCSVSVETQNKKLLTNNASKYRRTDKNKYVKQLTDDEWIAANIDDSFSNVLYNSLDSASKRRVNQDIRNRYYEKKNNEKAEKKRLRRKHQRAKKKHNAFINNNSNVAKSYGDYVKLRQGEFYIPGDLTPRRQTNVNTSPIENKISVVSDPFEVPSTPYERQKVEAEDNWVAVDYDDKDIVVVNVPENSSSGGKNPTNPPGQDDDKPDLSEYMYNYALQMFDKIGEPWISKLERRFVKLPFIATRVDLTRIFGQEFRIELMEFLDKDGSDVRTVNDLNFQLVAKNPIYVKFRIEKLATIFRSVVSVYEGTCSLMLMAKILHPNNTGIGINYDTSLKKMSYEANRIAKININQFGDFLFDNVPNSSMMLSTHYFTKNRQLQEDFHSPVEGYLQGDICMDINSIVFNFLCRNKLKILFVLSIFTLGRKPIQLLYQSALGQTSSELATQKLTTEMSKIYSHVSSNASERLLRLYKHLGVNNLDHIQPNLCIGTTHPYRRMLPYPSQNGWMVLLMRLLGKMNFVWSMNNLWSTGFNAVILMLMLLLKKNLIRSTSALAEFTVDLICSNAMLVHLLVLCRKLSLPIPPLSKLFQLMIDPNTSRTCSITLRAIYSAVILLLMNLISRKR